METLEHQRIHLSSRDRDLIAYSDPSSFTYWLDYKLRNIKEVYFDHIIFPTYLGFIKQLDNSNTLKTDIDTLFSSDVSLNQQYTVNSNTYEICNKTDISISFTINAAQSPSYEYILSTSTLVKYTPRHLTNPGNELHYININGIKHRIKHPIHPKLNYTSDLYQILMYEKIQYKKSDPQLFERMIISFTNRLNEQITFPNIDYNYSTTNGDYSSKDYYIRHPLNDLLQYDVFIGIIGYVTNIKIDVFNY